MGLIPWFEEFPVVAVVDASAIATLIDAAPAWLTKPMLPHTAAARVPAAPAKAFRERFPNFRFCIASPLQKK
jgi:hypothetical protein